MRSGADTLIWGDRAEPAGWDLRSALEEINAGRLSSAIRMLQHPEVADAIARKMAEEDGQKAVEDLLRRSSAIGLRTIFSSQMGICGDADSGARLHILDTPEEIYDPVFQPRGMTICGIDPHSLIAARQGLWQQWTPSARCEDCEKSADMKSILAEELPAIKGVDIQTISSDITERLASRRNINERTLRLAIRAASLRAGADVLAKEAEGRDDFLPRAWGEDHYEKLRQADPNFMDNLSRRVWRRWFLRQSCGSNTPTGDRITLFNLAAQSLTHEERRELLF